MEVTTCRMCLEVRQPEEMRTTSPVTREEVGSETRCVVWEGKCWEDKVSMGRGGIGRGSGDRGKRWEEGGYTLF